MITKRQARFLMAACARDGADARSHLSSPWVAAVDGVRWIVATDGHRLHAVRAPLGLDYEGWVAVDCFGGVYPVSGKPATPPPLALAWASGRDMKVVDRLRLDSVAAAQVEGMAVMLDAKLAPRVKCFWEDIPKGAVCLNPKLLHDALALARPEVISPPERDFDGFDGFDMRLDPDDDGDDDVEMSCGDAVSAVVVQHHDSTPLWRAVIMPVRS